MRQAGGLPCLEHKPTGLCSLGDRPEGLSLPCAFMRNVPEGGECGKDKYILRNEANKPFRINKSSSEEVQKAIKRRTEISKREVI